MGVFIYYHLFSQNKKEDVCNVGCFDRLSLYFIFHSVPLQGHFINVEVAAIAFFAYAWAVPFTVIFPVKITLFKWPMCAILIALAFILFTNALLFEVSRYYPSCSHRMFQQSMPYAWVGAIYFYPSVNKYTVPDSLSLQRGNSFGSLL